MNNNQNIAKFFKAYDMRATVPELDAQVYYWIGLGLVKTILIPENLPMTVNATHDGRYSSPEFYAAFCKGVIDGGGEVNYLGLASTDFMYASTQVTGTPGAIITASHNPKDDNGIKIVKEGCTMLGINEGLAKVRDFVVQNYGSVELNLQDLIALPTKESLKSEITEYLVLKIQELGEIVKVDKLLQSRGQKLKIPVDSANGMGGWVMEIVKNLYTNIEFIPLYWEVDGTFPNHPADPIDFENLRDLQKSVIENAAVCGVAFDGDADRAFFVDEKGAVVQGDYLVAEFARSLIIMNKNNSENGFNNAAVYCQPGSRCAIEAITEADGVAIPSMQGHTFIKAQMKNYKAIYGGEYSGHHYFGDFGYMDSGVLAMVLLIKIMVEKNLPLSQVFAKLTSEYHISPLMNLSLPAGDTFEDWKAKLKSGFSDASFSEMDGITVFYQDWKFSMRSSNTEPKVRFILETHGVDKVSEKTALVKSVIGV